LDQVKSLKAVAFPSVQPSTRNCHDSGHYKRPLFKRASPWERIGQNKGRRPQPVIIQKKRTEAVTLELNNNYMCKPLNDFKCKLKKYFEIQLRDMNRNSRHGLDAGECDLKTSWSPKPLYNEQQLLT
jgi:hypothetical protein